MRTLIVVVLFLVAGLVAAAVLRAVLRLRGTRLVTCPETQSPEAVEMDLRYAALGGAVGHPLLTLSACSRWPERGRCGMPCLDQIEASPEGCLVKVILAHWYRDRSCVYCRARFGDVHWHDHKPALLAPGGALVEWKDLVPEAVPATLATHQPVCWNCLIAQTLRRQRPDLFEYRPPRPGARAV